MLRMRGCVAALMIAMGGGCAHQDASAAPATATQQSAAGAFPAIGQTYEANFNDGTIVVHLAFDKDGEHMTFTDAGSKMPGMKASETIRYTAVEIRPQVFVVYWQEKDKMTVVHVEDFERGIVRTHITSLRWTPLFGPRRPVAKVVPALFSSSVLYKQIDSGLFSVTLPS